MGYGILTKMHRVWNDLMRRPLLKSSMTLGFKFQLPPTMEVPKFTVPFNAFTTYEAPRPAECEVTKVPYSAPRPAMKC
jgi:hypothetical protein